MSTADRRGFLRALVGGAVGVAGPRGSASPATARPNIIVMLADDMGFSDLGCYGGEIETPNLNRLAARGVRFTQFYNTARCCPTRASLLTGLYAHQAGVGHMVSDYGLPGYRGDLNRSSVTIAEVLKPAGYTTLMAGKWHVTPPDESKHNWPLQRGFDHYYGTIMGGGSYYAPVSLTRDNEHISPKEKDFYYTDALADAAAGFIGEYGPKDNPFFLYLAFTSPHWPLHAPAKAVARYKGRFDMGWDELRARRHKRMVEMGLVDARWPLTPRDGQAPAWRDAPNKAWYQRRMEVYAAQIDIMDQGVGRIVARLKELGILDNTLILFLADNGGCAEELDALRKGPHIPEVTRQGRPVRRGNNPSIMPGAEDTFQSYGIGWANASNTPFRLYKHWVHEGGISTPLIAHWPARIRRPGTLTHQPGHLIDLMATCVDVAGARYPGRHSGITPLEGKPLTPVIEGREREPHRALFWEHEGNRAVRQDKWKLVSRHPGDWELYDLEADRTEMNNLIAKEPDRAAELARAYEAWARRANVAPWQSWKKS